MQCWKITNCLSSYSVLVIAVTLFFPKIFGELDDDALYPIIINTDADTAVFILPELGCHVVQDFRSRLYMNYIIKNLVVID